MVKIIAAHYALVEGICKNYVVPVGTRAICVRILPSVINIGAYHNRTSSSYTSYMRAGRYTRNRVLRQYLWVLYRIRDE